MATQSSLRQKLKYEEWEINGKRITLVTLHLFVYPRQLPDDLYGLRELEALSLKTVTKEEINLPNELAKLTNLKVLSLFNCGLTTVPAAVMKLPMLEKLILSRNMNITLRGEISRLINLTVLDLKFCNLDTLPPVVLKLPNLQVLDLRDNVQIFLPYDLYRLNNLKVLRLGGCNLDRFPPAVLKLLQLEELDLSNNRIITLPDGLAGLINIRVLKLWLTGLDTLPPQVGKLTLLEWLDLSANQLQTLPEEIGQLTSVKHLNLSKCKLLTLPLEVGRLTRLEQLYLRHNQLQTLPAEVAQLSSLRGLHVKGNPLIKPPAEICKQGITAIRQYFDELKRSKENIISHLKIVFLGEKMAGKTSLVRTLDIGKSTLTEVEDRTHCVEITQWAPDDNITFEVYDFGGHDVYYLTHQFFLTPDALYLLLVNLQTYSCSEERYTEAVGFWLDTLNARVPGAVVSIVGSKKDLCRHDEVIRKTNDIQSRINMQKKMWLKQLKQEIKRLETKLKTQEKGHSSLIAQQLAYTNRLLEQRLRFVGDVLCVSVKPKSPIRSLLSSKCPSWVNLQTLLLENVNNKSLFPTLRRVLPGTWVLFEQLLKRWRETPEQVKESDSSDKTGSSKQTQSYSLARYWLTLGECEGIGRDAELSPERLDPVLSYLQQVGTILRYTDIPELKDYVFHDPPVVVELFKDLYHHDTKALFSTPRIRNKYTREQRRNLEEDLCDRGLIQKKVMTCMLPPNIDPDIVTALMQHFGLCFELKGNDKQDLSKQILHYKIPWYLHKQMPEKLKSVWPDDVPEDQEQLQLMCNITGFCPRGLFQRFSVGIHRLVKDRVDWKDGVMAYRQDYPILMRSKPVTDDTYIAMATRGRLAQADEMWGVVHPLLEVLVQLLQEWPGVLYSLHVTCAHCIKAGLGRPYQHELRDRTAEDGRDVRCPRIKNTASTSANLVYRPSRLSGKQYPAEAQSQQDVAGRSQAEEEDISRYFHYIKENVTAEWKDLAYQLGFSRPDIDNIDERNTDYKRRCRDTLEEWKEREGDAATITVLMDALRELELMSVVDGLESKYPGLSD
ncbi:PREDICTED: malignant fibrous histiocytoma-amplified sequence 1 homolog [Branchiostoma belcheri]|uniref:Malignant fibrous histiocytoma-amplified sequence 1 homolog n=1 Tax=Branchiostoma belcheri TaxID=7741 RepID=A0A6P4Z367_BRABE|nr:PREDICTED: malignant fibrous histiocytoma-amplified sequence 1 homolog [Branchiostoma belcheri]